MVDINRMDFLEETKTIKTNLGNKMYQNLKKQNKENCHECFILIHSIIVNIIIICGIYGFQKRLFFFCKTELQLISCCCRC